MAKTYNDNNLPDPPTPAPGSGNDRNSGAGGGTSGGGGGFTEQQKRELREVMVEALREVLEDTDDGQDFAERVADAIRNIGGPPLG